MINIIFKPLRINTIGGVMPPDVHIFGSRGDLYWGQIQSMETFSKLIEYKPMVIDESVFLGLPLLDLTQVPDETAENSGPPMINMVMRNLNEIEIINKKAAQNFLFKLEARNHIEQNIGDVHDLLADQSKRIDWLERGLVRLLAHVLGGTQMSEEYVTKYKAFAENIISAVDNNEYIVRADLEDETELFTRIAGRNVEIASIVKTDYFDKWLA